MVKIQKISEIEPRLGFTEFDMLKKYRQSFATSELGRLHALFPFSELARQMHLKSSALGRKSYFSPEGKIALMVLKSYTNFSDAQLIEHLNGNIHYQLFCGVQIDPLHPLTNPKIVSAIRQELAHRLDVEPLQLILAEHWKPYLENLHVCMTDATCYESHLRFPTDTKLLWEGIVWLHRHLCKHCQTLHIQRPRNKYLDVRRAYLAYSKLRKRRKSQTRMITRRLLQLLENSILPTDNPMIACHNITGIVHYIIVGIICKSHLVSDYSPYNFWLRKILPITDAILCFKPLVTSFLSGFYFFAINNMSFSCLF